MSPPLPVFYDIRLATITINELRLKETTENVNLLKAMGKTSRKIGEILILFRKSGVTIAIELDMEK